MGNWLNTPCSDSPCQPKCCPNPPGTVDTRSNCPACRMGGYNDECNTDGTHVFCNKKRCWMPDQVEDPLFWPWSMCGLNGGEPPGPIIKHWCSLPQNKDQLACKSIYVPCPPEMSKWECFKSQFKNAWNLLDDAAKAVRDWFAGYAADACEWLTGLLPDWLGFLTWPICWAVRNPDEALWILVAASILFVAQPLFDLYFFSKV